MFISEVTSSAEEVETGQFGYSPVSQGKRRSTLRKLWKRWPSARRICLVELGGPRQVLHPAEGEVLYFMPRAGLYNRRCRIEACPTLEEVRDD